LSKVAVFLSGCKLFDDWRYFIQDAPFEIIRFFWWFLYKRADDLDPKVGKDKRKQMLGVTTLILVSPL